MKRISCIFVILFTSLSLGCSYGSKEANDKAVEKLRQQLLHGSFNEVYDQSSNIVRGQLTREEFLDKIKAATSELKEVDPELNWHRAEDSPDASVYTDDNWSSLNLEKNGRKINIQLDWNTPFDLCGISISGDIPEGGNRVFRNCD